MCQLFGTDYRNIKKGGTVKFKAYIQALLFLSPSILPRACSQARVSISIFDKPKTPFENTIHYETLNSLWNGNDWRCTIFMA